MTASIMNAYIHGLMVVSLILFQLFSPIQCTVDGGGVGHDGDALGLCLSQLSSRLQARAERLKSIVDKATRLWTIDRRAVIKVPIIVRHSIVAPNINATRILLLSPPPELLPTQDGSIIERLIHEKIIKISSLERKIDKEYLLKNGVNQAVRGTVTFTQPIRARKVTFDQLTVDAYLNQVPIWYLRDKVLRKSGHQTITGEWSFRRAVRINHLKITGSLHGLKTDDFLLPTSRSPQVVTGDVSVSQAHFGRLSVDRLNGVPIGDFVKRISPETQLITGQKHFKSVRVVHNLDVRGSINEKNLTQMLEKAILIDRPVTVNSDMVFSVPIKVDNLVAKRLGGDVDIDYVLNEGVVQGGHNEIVGTKVFQSLKARNVTIRGNVNSVRIPHDLVPLNEIVHISSKVVFRAPVEVRSGLNVEYINNVNPTRDVVLIRSSQPQTIRGRKRFQGDLRVEESIRLSSQAKLNGLDPAQLEKRVREIDGPQKASDYVFDGLRIERDLTVNQLNGFRISDLPSTLWSRTRHQTIGRPVKFHRTFSATDFRVPAINYHRIPHDLVLRNSKSPQTVGGNKTFRNATISTRIILKSGLINGQDVDRLTKDLLVHDKRKRQPVLCRGEKRFSKLKVSGNIKAYSVNGLNISRDYMLRDRPQVVYGHKTFNALVQVGKNVQTDELTVGYFDEHKVNEILDDIVLTGGGEISLVNKHFKMMKADNVNALGTINGLNLTEFRESVLTTNTPQNVLGPVIFHGTISFDRPISVRSINGKDIITCLSESKARGQQFYWPRPVRKVRKLMVPELHKGEAWTNISGVDEMESLGSEHEALIKNSGGVFI